MCKMGGFTALMIWNFL